MLRISVEEKKEYIAKIAAKVFSEKSYQAASLQDVAKEVGISKAGIYHYFKSKDDILGYLMMRYSNRFLDILRKCRKENKAKGLNRYDSDNVQRMLILRERHQLSDAYKVKLHKKEQAMFRLLKNEVMKIEAMDKSIDPNTIAFLFIAMSHWLGYWVKEGGKFSLEDIIEQNISIIFKGCFYGEQINIIPKKTEMVESL
jgi:AcrR family transcriptional regulator